MKYTAQSGKYILKNFLYIFPFAILPAFFLSISTDEGAIISVLKAVFKGNIHVWTFPELFRAISVLSFGSWQSVVFGIIGILVIVPCVALMMALLEKHFRIGKRTFNGLWSKLNDNFLSTCGYAVLVVVLYELWSLILSALLFLVSRIEIAVVAYILAGLFFVALHVLLLYAISMIYLWLPCMQITGFRAFEALHYSYQLVTPIRWRILWGQIVFLLGTEAALCLCAVFLPNPVVFMALTMFLYAVLIMLYFVRMEIAYFDRDQIERADVYRYYR